MILRELSIGNKQCFDIEPDLFDYVKRLQQENKILKENAEHNDKVVDKVNWENQLLKKENRKYKEVIDKVSSLIKLYGKYNGEKCTRCFSMMTADFNKLLDILKVGEINE